MTALDHPRFTVQLFKKRGDQSRTHNVGFIAGVDDDMVVVGGGAVARWTGIGALLNDSYPMKDMNGWTASSTNHIYVYHHELDVYALGLKVQGMTREELFNNMYVAVTSNSASHYPETTVHLPSDFLLLGGGAKTNSILTASFPSSPNSWTARFKAHDEPSSTSLTAFAIGIRRHLSVGTVETHIEKVDSGRESCPSARASVPSGFTLTGGGAEAHWEKAGNMLWKLKPTECGFEGGSKDHYIPDSCILSVYSVAMRLV